MDSGLLDCSVYQTPELLAPAKTGRLCTATTIAIDLHRRASQLQSCLHRTTTERAKTHARAFMS